MKATRHAKHCVSACKRVAFIHPRGFTYLGVLIALAILSVGLMAVSEVWVTSAEREKLAQLDWAGQQYQRAIASYYASTPSAVKTFPATLHELLEDHRFAVQRRHLRALYLNPFTGQMDWQLMKSVNGGVQGVQVSVKIRGTIQLKEFAAEVSSL
jgi:type II secretory pathway pseudopilin PulG